MKILSAANVTTVVLLGLSQTAVAQSTQSPGESIASPWYIGLGLGTSQGSIPQQTVNGVDAALSTALGSAFTIVDRGDRSTGLKAFLGYEFSRHFALEAGYAMIGQPKVDLDFRTGTTSNGTARLEYKMTSIFGDVVGKLPVGERWTFLGRVGINIGRTSVSFSGQPLTLIASADDLDETKSRVKFGGGVEYALNPAVAVRAEWERYRMPDPLSNELIDMDLAIASLIYRF